MFSFNPIFYFIKSFIRLFTRKFFWFILICIFLFLGFIIFPLNVNAVDSGVFGNYYGSFLNGMNISLSQVDDIIQQHKGNYDSFIIRQWGNSSNWYLYGCFYNESYAYKIYRMYYNDGSSVLSTQNYSTINNNTSPTIWFVIDNNGNYTEYPENNPNNTGGFHEFAVAENSQRGFYTNRTIYVSSTQLNSVLYSNIDISIQDLSPTVKPYFVTTIEELETFDFDYLQINGGTTKYSTYFEPLDETFTANFKLTYVYRGVATTIDVSNYVSIGSDNTWSINIPYNALTNNVIIRDDYEFNYVFEYSLQYETGYIISRGGTYNLTTEQEQQINNDSDKQVQGQILVQQQQTNDKLDDLQNTITDTTVPSDTEFDLPTIEVNDTTSNFFDTLFTGIYNAFNINEDITISFTIFSKTITINSGDFRMLNDSNFNVLRLLLESSWYFAIGYMVLKDIRLIFDKIKNGNIENAVSNDIKADMV